MNRIRIPASGLPVRFLARPGPFSGMMKALLRRFGKGFVLFGHGVDTAIDGADAVNRYTQLDLPEFQDVIALLQTLGYRFLSMRELLHYARDLSKAPKHWVHITFDDGYRNNIIVQRCLEAHEIPWSLFVSTGVIENRGRFGTYKVRCAILHTTKEIACSAFREKLPADASDTERISFADHVIRLMKSSRPADARRIEACCESLLSREEWDRLNGVYSSHEVLSLEQLRSLAGSRFISIGAHGLTHACLNGDSAPHEIEREIAGSKAWLEEHLPIRVRTFAYPDGQFTEAAKLACERSGYEIAFTTVNDFFCNSPGKYEIGRFPMPRAAVMKAICLSVVPTPLLRPLRSLVRRLTAIARSSRARAS